MSKNLWSRHLFNGTPGNGSAAPWTANQFLLDKKHQGFEGGVGLGNNKKHLEKAACFSQKIKVAKKKRVVGPLVSQKLLMSSVSWVIKKPKLHSSLPSKQHGMCLPTASLSKHEDCTNTAITCCLHNFLLPHVCKPSCCWRCVQMSGQTGRNDDLQRKFIREVGKPFK